MAIEVGNVFEGRVTGVKPFGAFVALPEGRVGMVHISEVSNEFVQDINTVLHDGDAVKVQVINIHRTARSRCLSSGCCPRLRVSPGKDAAPQALVRAASAAGRRVDAPAVAAQAVPPVKAAVALPGRLLPACGSPRHPPAPTT